jgi:hypothetical protein
MLVLSSSCWVMVTSWLSAEAVNDHMESHNLPQESLEWVEEMMDYTVSTSLCPKIIADST